MTVDIITIVPPAPKYRDTHVAIKWPAWANASIKASIARETALDASTNYRLVPHWGYNEFLGHLYSNGYKYRIRGDLERVEQ